MSNNNCRIYMYITCIRLYTCDCVQATSGERPHAHLYTQTTYFNCGYSLTCQ